MMRIGITVIVGGLTALSRTAKGVVDASASTGHRYEFGTVLVKDMDDAERYSREVCRDNGWDFAACKIEYYSHVN